MAEQETAPVKAAEGADIYEVGFQLVPTLQESEAADFALQLKEKLTKRGATLIADEAPKRIALAYTMARPEGGKRESFKEAYFGFIKFECPREEINALEVELRKDLNILRFLLIKTVRESAGASRRIFSSDRLEGETIKKRPAAERKGGPMTEEELDKTIEELVAEPVKSSS